MGDIGTRSGCNRDAKCTLLVTIVGEELGQVVDVVEEADPAVRVRIVARNFTWRVEATNLEGLG